MGRRKTDRWTVHLVIAALVLNLTVCAVNVYYARRFARVVTIFETMEHIIRTMGRTE